MFLPYVSLEGAAKSETCETSENLPGLQGDENIYFKTKMITFKYFLS